MRLPELRYVDASPVEYDGQTLVALHDPEGYVEDQVLLSPLAFYIATLLDGRTDIATVESAVAEQIGRNHIGREEITALIQKLDDSGFLLSEKFEAMRSRIDAAFAGSSQRQPYLAGRSYPREPGALREWMSRFFLHHDGPGRLPGEESKAPPVKCLIAPHIDLERGGHSYAHGYLRMHAGGRPKTVFVFGVAHAAPPVPFILCKKDFVTPLGALQVDTDAVEQLEQACAWDPYEFESVHRTEHSIEFQALMLAYLYGEGVRIVPILCGAFSPALQPIHPSQREEVAVFLETCKGILAERDGAAAVIAGADLAHVGRRFGDTFDIDDEMIEKVAARDREDLAHVRAVQPDAWYDSVMRDFNKRRVCGLNCIYSTLKCIEGFAAPGDLLHYGYAQDPAGGIVSFANLVFL
jgi:MEMO1 family protein